MRLVALPVGAALLLMMMMTSACNQYDDNESGSTGLNCTGEGTPPVCFTNNPAECFPFGVEFTRAVPAVFDLTVTSSEGDAFSYCISEEEGTLVSSLSINTAARYNFTQGQTQSGNLTLANVSTCGSDASARYNYRPQSAGVFRILNRSTFGFSVPLDPLDEENTTGITAQFCYDTAQSGSYLLTAEDGSRQSGTWTY